MSREQGPLSIREALEGKEILITGATGFLGKIILFMILKNLPTTRVRLLARGKKGRSAGERIEHEVMTSPVFDPLRQAMGEDAFKDYFRERVRPLDGDVSLPRLGMDDGAEVRAGLDLVIHSAGLTDFDPPLRQAIGNNTMAARNMLEYTRGLKKPRMVHISTTYVAGSADGRVPEDRDPLGWYPRQEELAVPFDVDREVEDCQRIIGRAQDESLDQEREAEFRERILERFKKEHKDPDDPDSYGLALGKERDKWIDKRLSEEGLRRAKRWGWPNTYTYSKSLAEQVLLKHRGDVDLAIVRPAILESAHSIPFPGWNEGINTSSPLTYMIWKGHRFYPMAKEHVIDFVPVDHVAAGILHVAAALMKGEHQRVYHYGSSHLNPVKVRRLLDLTDLGNREMRKKRTDVPAWERFLFQQLEAVPVSYTQYDTFSAPGVRRAAGFLSRALEAMPPGPFDILKGRAKKTLDRLEKATERTHRIIEAFLPFVYDYQYTFLADNSRALRERLSDEERAMFPFEPEKIDWRDYWLRVHVPGMHKWVFPEMDDLYEKSREKKTPEHGDLLELYRTSVWYHDKRVALRQIRKGAVEKYTFAELGERALRGAGFLAAHGVGKGDRVMLVSENRPEWAMALFAILESGATVVPVDHAATPAVVQNLARASGAKGVVLSQKVADKLAGAVAELACPVWPLETFFDAEPAPRGARPTSDEPALLIYTSGTTGTPKGVLLSHKNFASLVTSMGKVFEVHATDVFLSVLPLHHTFELTAGLLMPLARGASIAYMEELNADSLSGALREERVTVIIGVPALWQMLERKLRTAVKDRGRGWEKAFDALTSLNRWLRDSLRLRTPGRLLFNPVHEALGGNIRYLVSGGAALPPETFKFYRGLGFRMFEGYGMTEASPVIAVNRPGDKPVAGSVGLPLPGVDVKIDSPDETGVGEIWAKGPNIMLGYDAAPEATSQVLTEDGWLRTGDLGKFDKKGRLFITGRLKDVIVDAAGKNAYPDELEELYGRSPYLKELSVVGIPDGRGSEQVACLAVPDYAAHPDLERAAVQEKLREHIKQISSNLPYHQRIKIFRFWPNELPRTATKKILRTPVRAELARMLSLESKAQLGPGESHSDLGWLKRAVAALAGVGEDKVRPETRFAEDLSFDSLLSVELALEIERRTGVALTEDDLAQVATVGQLADRIGQAPKPKDPGETSGARPAVAEAPFRRHRPDEADQDFPTPYEPLRQAVKSVLGRAQMDLYGKFFDTRVTGAAHIPRNRNALVVANHSSHLDSGLVKYALRDWAPELGALAARDYFFSSKLRRYYFGNFTNVVPMERAGSPDESMRDAIDRIKRGENLLIFPEGTRSDDGQVREFKHGVGWLVIRSQVDVLPVYTWGTHRAMPKGALMIPRSRRIGAKIGPVLPFAWLFEKVQGLPRREQYRAVARMCREAVEALKDDRPYGPGVIERKELPAADMSTLFEELEKRFQPGNVDRPLKYYFSLGGGERWSLHVSGDACEAVRGKPDVADCVVKTTPEILRRIVREQSFPSMEEITDGQFKTNDLGLISTFRQAFKL